MVYSNYSNYNSYSNINSLYNSSNTSKTSNSSLDANFLKALDGLKKNSNYYNETALKGIQGIKGGAKDLASALNSLRGPAYMQKSAVSSDTDSVSVEASTYARYTSLADTKIDIQQVATAQANGGSALASSEAFGTAGSYKIEIATGDGKTHQVSFDVADGDTNKAVQQRIADAVNKLDIGVSASVSNDSDAGTSALTFQSKATGTGSQSAFTVKDITGNAIATTGTSSVTQEAQNAIYRVNGGEQKTSASNDVYLGNGITATLKKASQEPVTISTKVSSSSAVSSLKDMVSSYNKLLSSAKDNNSSRLASELSGVTSTYATSLSKVGVSFDKDGYMTLDETKALASSEDGSIRNLFDTNTNYGFAQRLNRVASNVSQNTARYVDKVNIQNSLYESFQSALESYNTYTSTQTYNQYSAVGMLFNYLV